MKILKTPTFLVLLLLCSISCDNTPKKTDNTSKNEKLSFTELGGTLDEALATAKDQNKHLLVVSAIPECSACDVFFQVLQLNTKVKEELAKHFLVYENNQAKAGNEYLFWAFNNIASPTCFIFSPKGELINIAGNTAISSKNGHNILKAIRTGNSIETPIHNVISLPFKETVEFVNTLLKAFRILNDPQQNTAILKETLRTVEKTITQYPYFFNHYLASELAKKLQDIATTTKHSKSAKAYYDNYAIHLFKELYNTLEQYKQH